MLMEENCFIVFYFKVQRAKEIILFIGFCDSSNIKDQLSYCIPQQRFAIFVVVLISAQIPTVRHKRDEHWDLFGSSSIAVMSRPDLIATTDQRPKQTIFK